ncbi:glycosyltransferase family 4 protein [uncultured Aureimonas sp.]|uniref:glycosyltransferase family 4 protein n=1 Tax=uncultured Aureimonas sp. TaxID=1604662 RepID=UPI0025F68DB5|nr:glycosyltransferase family 4 protein [uncultured Aureimonas sp.]
MPSCVIVVENLPVPLDRRVWQEACALRDAGWTVSVICPKSQQFPAAFETIDDIEIFRHNLPLEASGKFAFLYEYAAALFHELRLLLKVSRRRGFDVIQACNPPDLIFLVAAPFKLFGKKFVFDHHDVCPELFVAKFERKGFFHSLLLMAEKATFRTADLVISANETYRSLAISRGGKKPEDVVTVYSVPDKARIRRVAPNEALRAGAGTVLGYVGIIADQDGVDHLVRCVHHLVADHGQRDIRAVVVGDGPALASVRQLAGELGVAEHITFTGYLRGEDLLAALSTFDIGIIPDPVNEYNDKISMNKVFEYSALGIPSVSYDLTETRRLLGDAGRYAADATPAGLAAAARPLIEDLELRRAAGLRAKALADAQFDWDREAERYVAAYARLAAPARAKGLAGA